MRIGNNGRIGQSLPATTCITILVRADREHYDSPRWLKQVATQTRWAAVNHDRVNSVGIERMPYLNIVARKKR
jgi:hypothetical protein